jgi:hypothetical protein
VLLAAALAAEQIIAFGLFRAWALAAAATIVVVIGAAVVMLPWSLPVSAAATWRDDPRVATAVLVRRTTRPALIEVETGEAPAGTPLSQSMTATFNGTPIGTFGMASSHGETTLVVPSRLWQIGVNRLELAIPERIEITRVTARSPQ